MYLGNRAGYYGFDTDNSATSEFKFGYIDVPLSNAVNVYAGDVEIIVKTDSTFYVWGYSLNFDENQNHNLFDGTPILVNP